MQQEEKEAATITMNNKGNYLFFIHMPQKNIQQKKKQKNYKN